MNLPYTVRLVLSFVGAAVAGGLVFVLTRQLRFGPAPATRVAGTVDVSGLSSIDRQGESWVQRLGLSLDTWRLHLRWAQLDGKLLNRTVGGAFLRAVLQAAFVVVLVLIAHMPVWFLFGAVIGFMQPILGLRGRGNDARRAALRLLPETATVAAAEMAAGASPADAVARAAEIPGPLGKLLGEAIQEAQRSGRPLFSSGPARGALVDSVSAWKLDALTGFIVQLDRVAAKGVQGPALMREVARSVADSYAAQAAQAAATMEHRLLFPMFIFIFMPFLLALMMPMMLSIFSIF